MEESSVLRTSGVLGICPWEAEDCFILHACPFKNVSMYSITWTVISGNSPLRVEPHILFCLDTHLGSGSLCLDFTCTCVKGVFTVALLNCNPVVEVCSWYICNVKDFYFIFYAMYLLSSSLPYPDPWRAWWAPESESIGLWFTLSEALRI